MQLQTLGPVSRSCVALSSDTETLLLDCGSSYPSTARDLDWNLTKIVGTLMTYNNQSAVKTLKQLLNRIAKPIAANSALASLFHSAIATELITVVKPNQSYSLGSFKFMPISISANEPCFAYLVKHDELGILLYCANASQLPDIDTTDINHIVVETYYSEQLVKQFIEHDMISSSMLDIVKPKHISVEQVKEYIVKHQFNDLRTLIMFNLCDGISNEDDFKYQTRYNTKANIIIPKRNFIYNI